MVPTQCGKGSEEEDLMDENLQVNWEHYRKLSLKAGGFGEDRTQAWTYLLHAQNLEEKEGNDGSSSPSAIRQRKKRNSKVLDQVMTADDEKAESRPPPSSVQHPDEHQIKLDTDRSFVLYPVGHSDREELQEDLNAFITAIFRSHPALSYFQGYHDIITVLFLTLPEQHQLRCAERLSLHRLRDAMGKGLEPLIGLLRILRYLLRLVDAEYAALLERNTPLPYFALSNLLTLFAHDVPTLPLIQHVFDYLLSRPPIASVYLAAAITIARKDEAYKMEEEGEDGMLHSLLSTLPELIDEKECTGIQKESDHTEQGVGDDGKIAESSLKDKDEFAIIDDEKSHLEVSVVGEILYDSPSRVEHEGLQGKTSQDPSVGENSDDALTQHNGVVNASQPPGSSAWEESGRQPVLDASTILSTEASNGYLATAVDHSSRTLPSPSSSESPPPSPSPPSSEFPQQQRRRRAAVSLPDLLTHADALFERFPPTHPSLHLSEIIGPKSVIFTWSEDPAQLLSDAEAEALIAHPELVILPYQDPDELPFTKEGEDSDQYDSDVRPKKGRRKLRKRRRRGDPHFGVALDRKTVLTGAVVALGVAVAVYSVRSRNGHGPFDVARADREWRRAGRWVSGVLIGGSQKLLDTFGW